MMERATEIAPAARRRKSMTAQTAKSDLETIVEVERLSVKRRAKFGLGRKVASVDSNQESAREKRERRKTVDA